MHSSIPISNFIGGLNKSKMPKIQQKAKLKLFGNYILWIVADDICNNEGAGGDLKSKRKNFSNHGQYI